MINNLCSRTFLFNSALYRPLCGNLRIPAATLCGFTEYSRSTNAVPGQQSNVKTFCPSNLLLSVLKSGSVWVCCWVPGWVLASRGGLFEPEVLRVLQKPPALTDHPGYFKWKQRLSPLINHSNKSDSLNCVTFGSLKWL